MDDADAALTHPNLICQQANALFAMGIAHAIQSGCDRKELYQHIRQWAADMPVEPALLNTIDKAADEPPADYVHQQGWVMIAFQNARTNCFMRQALRPVLSTPSCAAVTPIPTRPFAGHC